jgi:hypothetical protein
MGVHGRNHAVDVAEHLVIGKSDHPVATGFEKIGPSGVVGAAQIVVRPIDLDDELRAGTQEVDHIGTDWHLPPEVPACNLAPAQADPDSHLGARHPPAQRPRQRRTLHAATPSFFLPLQAGGGGPNMPRSMVLPEPVFVVTSPGNSKVRYFAEPTPTHLPPPACRERERGFSGSGAVWFSATKSAPRTPAL